MTEAPMAQWYVAVDRLVHGTRVHWRMVITLALVGGLVSAGTALLLPSYYASSAAFQAEASQLPQVGGTLAGLASQLGGIQLPQQSNPQLFAELLTTETVLRRVAHSNYPWQEAWVPLSTVYGYEHDSEAWRDYRTLRRLRKAIAVNVNVRTGVVRFTVEARTPPLAKAIAESALVALNLANIALRQARATAERAFTSDRAEHARGELAAAESVLARFYDRNRTITNSPALVMEESRLRRSVDMAQQVYVQLRLQAEQAAVQEVRNTPAISVVDPPVQPVRRSRPKRRVVVLLGAAIGLLVASLRILALPGPRTES